MAHELTELLMAHGQGVDGAFDRLVDLVYSDLRRIARAQLRRIRPGQTLDTTALVNEAYLKLVDHTRVQWRDRAHFMAVTATAMRQILIDYAKARSREKRGGGAVVEPLDESRAAVVDDAERLLDVDRALQQLTAVDPRLVRVVECRYFAGYSDQETADALGVSLRTAQRDWLRARAWLRQALRPS